MKTKARRLLCSGTALLGTLACLARALGAAGDENWDVNFGVPGANGLPYCLSVLGESLFVGGHFSAIGGVNATNVAKWDGHNWSPLGLGVNGTVSVMAESGGNLFVAGTFTAAGGVAATNVAMWDGGNWSALGAGTMWDGTNWVTIGAGIVGNVTALAASGNKLFAGGNMSSAGGIPVSNVAQWTASGWSDLSGGVSGGLMNGQVTALAADGTNLYVGGYFRQAGSVPATNVAKWDGVSWSAMANPDIAPPAAIRVQGQDIYVMAMNSTGLWESGFKILKWTGADWSQVAGGNLLEPGWCSDCVPNVRALEIVGTDLFVCGQFYGIGGPGTQSIDRWNGTNWSPLGIGLGPNPFPYLPQATSLAWNGSELFVAGSFGTAGGQPSVRIALWRFPQTLEIDRSADTVTLAWSSAATNLLVETSESIADTNWVALAVAPTILDTHCLVTNAVDTRGRFYRLRRK